MRRTGSNLGYAFVNFTSAAGAWRLHRAFHRMKWSIMGSKKVCEVTYARIQVIPELCLSFSLALGSRADALTILGPAGVDEALPELSLCLRQRRVTSALLRSSSRRRHAMRRPSRGPASPDVSLRSALAPFAMPPLQQCKSRRNRSLL